MILLAPPLHDASSSVFGAFSDVLPQIVVLLVVYTFVLHLIIASWIIQDARKLQNETRSNSTAAARRLWPAEHQGRWLGGREHRDAQEPSARRHLVTSSPSSRKLICIAVAGPVTVAHAVVSSQTK